MADGYRAGSKYIENASGDVNDAVNLWGDSTSEIYEAWLPYDALSKEGESACLKYEAIRNETLETLYKASAALIEVRETLSAVAGGYKRTELDNEKNIGNVRPIRPELR
jgi:hypothetical protein